MTRYVGVCAVAELPAGQRALDPLERSTYGLGDVVGNLLVETGEGWMIHSTHVSSNASFSQLDIAGHYARVAVPTSTYEWVGVLDTEECIARFPPAPWATGAWSDEERGTEEP